MAGYLDHYGAGEERRNRIISRAITVLLVALVVGSLSWYLFENHHQESVVKSFVSAVRSGDLQGAYRIWGCTPQKPCSGYPFDKFSEDWSPQSPAHPDGTESGIFGLSDSESCNAGVLLTVNANRSRTEKLWVAKNEDSISFAPFPICPHKSPFAIMLHRTIGRLRKPLLK